MRHLKPADFTVIQSLIAEVETKTKAEVVPLVLKRANDYNWIHSVMAFEGMLLGILGGWAWSHFHAFPLHFSEGLKFAFFGSFVGLVLSFFPAISRRSIGKARLVQEVHARAFAEFVRQGCAETPHRLGVLILVSLYEHRIQIIADRGVQEKMVKEFGPEVWEGFCTHFVAFAKKGQAVEGLAEVIRKLSSALAEHFPDDGSAHNYLSNELRTDE